MPGYLAVRRFATAVVRLAGVLAADVEREVALDVAFFAGAFAVALDVVFLAAAVFVAALDVVFLAAAVFLDAAFFEFSASLKAEAGAKRTPLDAAILTGVLVCGLRPIRAA